MNFKYLYIDDKKIRKRERKKERKKIEDKMQKTQDHQNLSTE